MKVSENVVDEEHAIKPLKPNKKKFIRPSLLTGKKPKRLSPKLRRTFATTIDTNNTTGILNRALLALYLYPASGPAALGARIWRGHPGWNRVSKCGAYGSTRGGGMNLMAGGYLGKMKREGLAISDSHDYLRTWKLTGAGIALAKTRGILTPAASIFGSPDKSCVTAAFKEMAADLDLGNNIPVDKKRKPKKKVKRRKRSKFLA